MFFPLCGKAPNAVTSGCRMEARLEQRRSQNRDIDEQAVGIVQFRLKL